MDEDGFGEVELPCNGKLLLVSGLGLAGGDGDDGEGIAAKASPSEDVNCDEGELHADAKVGIPDPQTHSENDCSSDNVSDDTEMDLDEDQDTEEGEIRSSPSNQIPSSPSHAAISDMSLSAETSPKSSRRAPYIDAHPSMGQRIGSPALEGADTDLEDDNEPSEAQGPLRTGNSQLTSETHPEVQNAHASDANENHDVRRICS